MFTKAIFIFLIIAGSWTGLHSQATMTELLKVQGSSVLISEFDEIILVNAEQSYYLIDTLGTVYFEIEKALGNRLSSTAIHTLFKLRVNNLEGLIDSYGKEIIPPIYDYLSVVTPDVYRIRKDGKEAIINSSNELLHDYMSKYAIGSEGEYYYFKDDSDQTLRDKEGKIILDVDPLNRGKKVGTYTLHDTKDKTTIYDKNGRVVYTGRRIALEKFGDNFILYSKRKKGLLDQNLDTLLPPIYKRIDQKTFNDGNALVENDGQYNVLSVERGALLSKDWYDDIIQMKDSYVCINNAEDSKKLKVFSKDWVALNELTLPKVYHLYGTFLVAETKGMHDLTIFDSQGNEVPIPHERIRGARICNENIAVRANNQKFGIYDKNGNEIAPCKYDFVNCYENFSLLEIGDTLVRIDDKIIATSVDFYKVVGKDKIIIENKAGLYGLIDKEGNEILPYVYSDIKSVGRNKNYILAVKEGTGSLIRLN